MLDWFKKEKPLQGLAGMGGGVVSRNLVAGGGLGASGGTVTTHNGYTVHTFTYSGSPEPFTVDSGTGNANILLVADIISVT